MASVTLTSLGLGSVASVTSVTPSCTRYFDILGPGPPLFFVFFPSRPLPLTPPGRVLNGRSKTLAPGGRQIEATRDYQRLSLPFWA